MRRENQPGGARAAQPFDSRFHLRHVDMLQQSIGNEVLVACGKREPAAAAPASTGDAGLGIDHYVVWFDQLVGQQGANAICVAAGKQPGLATRLCSLISSGQTSASP